MTVRFARAGMMTCEQDATIYMSIVGLLIGRC